mmetsp:Transcript_27827/g.46755  ORF Transcript_27827/g.46755 Transcript_27827/m.46755 type:complete len:262 (+) Transcript_27827:906-1691(+)
MTAMESKDDTLHLVTPTRNQYESDESFSVCRDSRIYQFIHENHWDNHWSNSFVNFCFFLLYGIIQANSVVLIRRLEILSFPGHGIWTFSLTLVMDMLLVIQPPDLMCWIPFWSNSFGRGFVLCFTSIVVMQGSFLLGGAALVLSLVVMVSRLFTGGYNTPPPLLSYARLFPRSSTHDTRNYGTAVAPESVEENRRVVDVHRGHHQTPPAVAGVDDSTPTVGISCVQHHHQQPHHDLKGWLFPKVTTNSVGTGNDYIAVPNK